MYINKLEWHIHLKVELDYSAPEVLKVELTKAAVVFKQSQLSKSTTTTTTMAIKETTA